jgi:hypothetical protein
MDAHVLPAARHDRLATRVTNQELRRLRDPVVGRPSPYVLFNDLPRVGDAERFLDLL